MELLGPYKVLHQWTEAAHASLPVFEGVASRRKLDASYTRSRLPWSSCLLAFPRESAQGNSHPAESSKVCEMGEDRHAEAPDSCHTGSSCCYGYSTHARFLFSGLGAVAFIH